MSRKLSHVNALTKRMQVGTVSKEKIKDDKRMNIGVSKS